MSVQRMIRATKTCGTLTLHILHATIHGWQPVKEFGAPILLAPALVRPQRKHTPAANTATPTAVAVRSSILQDGPRYADYLSSIFFSIKESISRFSFNYFCYSISPGRFGPTAWAERGEDTRCKAGHLSQHISVAHSKQLDPPRILAARERDIARSRRDERATTSVIELGGEPCRAHNDSWWRCLACNESSMTQSITLIPQAWNCNLKNC